MSGIYDLAKAFTGGGAIEGKAYDDRMARMLSAANSRAATEKKLLDAAKMRDEMAARGRLSDSFGGQELDLILSGLASQGKAVTETRGIDQDNQARAEALNIARQMLASGEVPPIDLLNAFIGVEGSKLLGKGNVNVAGQADAAVDSVKAQTAQRIAGEAENLAQAALAEQKTATEAAKTDPDAPIAATPGVLTGPQISMFEDLYRTVPNPKYDPDAWVFTGDKEVQEQVLPTDYMTWAGKMFEQTGDRSYLDPSQSLYKFLAQLDGPAPQAPAQQRAELQEAKENLYSTRADVEAAIAAGTLKSGDTFTDPNGVLRRVP